MPPLLKLCSVEGCGLKCDFWLDGDGKKRFFKWCQKHRKGQPKKRRILDSAPTKEVREYSKDGRPLCMVLGCHRLCIRRISQGVITKFADVCGFHGRSWHEHQDRKLKKIFNSRMRRYGITTEDFEKLKSSRGELCEICELQKWTSIDHCHTTGKVRGLLCVNCNAGIGHLKESDQIMLKAVEYIRKHKPK